MARRFRPLSKERIGELPSSCAGCMFWESWEKLPMRCGAVCDAAGLGGWMDYVRAQWGDCGRVAYQDGRVLGFVKYAPAAFFPQIAHMPAGRPDDNAILLSCIHVEPDSRDAGLGRVLLHAALRDLSQRHERVLEAYAAHRLDERLELPVPGVEFLLRQGFTVARPHPEYPLMRLELKSLVAWTENVEAVLESLHLPLPKGVPAPTPR